MSVTSSTGHDVVQIVRRYVDQHQPKDYRLVVSDQPVRREEDWWTVVVRPDRGGVKSHHYSEWLTDIEDEIWEKEGVRVFMVPMIADD